MNQNLPPERDPPDAAPKPSMAEALEDVFATSHQRGFAEKLVRFAEVLSNAQWAACLTKEEAEAPVTIAGLVPEARRAAVEAVAAEVLSDAHTDQANVRSAPPVLFARVALPSGVPALLVLGMPAGNKVQNALSYERMVFLSSLTFARNRPADRTRQDKLIKEIEAVARGQTRDLGTLANLLALQTGASYAAVAWWRAGAVEAVQISGQDNAAKRASLPDLLRQQMRDTASQRLLNSERAYAAAADQAEGLVLHLERPTRNLSTLQHLAAVFALVQQRRSARWFTPERWIKAGVVALVLLGVGLIPLPDSVALPALVEARSQRVVTSPVTARLDEVLVRDGDSISQAGARLIRLDGTEFQAELIGLRAEQAKALLEREAARAARNPAALRNAELEVERLKSRIALLEFRLQNTRVLAPIAGLVVAPDLQERQGTTVRQGEELLTIADPGALRLKLSIPETQIGKLQIGDRGVFRPDYDPTLRFDGAVALISPARVSEERDGQMFFGRAGLEGSHAGLRPGLNGVLTVNRDMKPLGQIMYEAIRNYVLLRLWF